MKTLGLVIGAFLLYELLRGSSLRATVGVSGSTHVPGGLTPQAPGTQVPGPLAGTVPYGGAPIDAHAESPGLVPISSYDIPGLRRAQPGITVSPYNQQFGINSGGLRWAALSPGSGFPTWMGSYALRARARISRA